MFLTQSTALTYSAFGYTLEGILTVTALLTLAMIEMAFNVTLPGQRDIGRAILDAGIALFFLVFLIGTAFFFPLQPGQTNPQRWGFAAFCALLFLFMAWLSYHSYRRGKNRQSGAQSPV